MDKQTLRYTYLTYFAGQYAKKEDMDYYALVEMAGDNYELCTEVIKELVDEGLVLGIELIKTKVGYAVGQYQGKLKLTAKGIKEILNLFPDEKKEIIDDIKSDIEDKNHKILSVEDIINKENERISKLSKKEKEEEIKTKILELFKYLLSKIEKYPNGKITNNELKEKIKKIVKIYFKSIPQIYAKSLTGDLLKEGYITFLYQKGNEGSYDIDKLLTTKAIDFLNKIKDEEEQEIQKYFKEHNIKFPNVDIPSGLMQAYKSIYNNPTLIKAIEQSSILTKYMYNNIPNLDYSNIQMAIEAASNIPSNIAFNYIPQNKKDNINDDINKTYTFEGILGRNCGEVVTPTSEDIKRIREKGFKVENGIKVLRGFANSAILAFASRKDENYQREENPKHLNAIEKFVKNMRTSAKYLPEVTLIARGYEKLEKINLSGTLSEKQRGEIENLEYYKLTVSESNLYRIDGNHRLEALKRDNYYIPFSIIIWEDIDINPDDEAFLFYFLNNKAKKLTTEENLKGLVNATTWKSHELLEANKHLPHLQYLEEQIQTSKFLSSYFCNNEPIKNIAEILERIEDNIEFNQFQEILSLTNELLIHDKWSELKQFDFYCQLVFYIAYKTPYKKACLSVLDNINNWVKKYKFDNTTFDNPIMLYKSAEKTNNTRPIKVFIAMPYYGDEIIEDVNDQLKKLSEELIKAYPLLENRFEIYEVMKHRGYEIDIQNQIMEQIKSASIFIADISEHICKKGTKTVDCHANPNVMYELGIAKGQPYTEIILLKNKNDKIEAPSDIITKYHNKFELDKKVSMRKKLFEAIESILKDKFEII